MAKQTARPFTGVIRGTSTLSLEDLRDGIRTQLGFNSQVPRHSPVVVDPNRPPTFQLTFESKPLPKNASRPKRWSYHCARALDALDRLEEVLGDFKDAVEELNAVREEYVEWNGNLPENMQGTSALSEKLEAIEGLDIEDAASELESAITDARGKIEEADNAELPQGFGRD